ncbi:MAG: serpin family protein [Elusimicrobia bacterium]|nr:serpin family protein [Elusimicrobiota bacterium]
MKKTAMMLGVVLWVVVAAGVARADNSFAVDLYRQYTLREGNIFFSPYSLSSALEMAYEGARGNTASEMRSVLGLLSDEGERRERVSEEISRFNRSVEDMTEEDWIAEQQEMLEVRGQSSSDARRRAEMWMADPGIAENLRSERYELRVANALWAQEAYPFLPEYLDIVTRVYSAEARNLDFIDDPEGSRITINDWVAERTKDRIQDLLPLGSIDSLTRLVLTNAVYFKGKWAHAFEEDRTSEEVFWLDADRSVPVQMMFRSGGYEYFENDLLQVLRLPYKGPGLSMIVLLPKDRALGRLEKDISASDLKEWTAALHFEETVEVSLPRFRFEQGHEMKESLVALGMREAFDDNFADFSGMTGEREIYIDQVYHKAFIDVNEEGTEAAAATAVVMDTLGMPMMNNKVFLADHPFLFLIEDQKTGTILFMGRVMDPTK